MWMNTMRTISDRIGSDGIVLVLWRTWNAIFYRALIYDEKRRVEKEEELC